MAATLQGPTGVRIEIGRTAGEGRDDKLTTNVFLGEGAHVVKPPGSKAYIMLGRRERNCCAAYALAACFSITAVKDTAVSPLYVGVRRWVGRELSRMMRGPAGDYKRDGGAGQTDRSVHSGSSEEHIGCCNYSLSDERITFISGAEGSATRECNNEASGNLG